MLANVLDRLVQPQRRERVVLVIGEWIHHRALVAVIGRELEHEVEVARQARERRVLGDRALDQRDRAIVGKVLALAREQVVDDHDPFWSVIQQRPDEIGADEAGASDDEDPRAAERSFGHSPTRRCVYVSAIPLLAVVADRLRDALLERHGHVPAEVGPDPRGIEQDRVRIVLAARPHLYVLVERDPEGVDGRVEQLLDRVIRTGGDVVVAVACAVDDGLHDDVDEVVDVDEVAPRVHHEAPLALGQALEEGRQRVPRCSAGRRRSRAGRTRSPARSARCTARRRSSRSRSSSRAGSDDRA